jgi:serine/threonine protein kinase
MTKGIHKQLSKTSTRQISRTRLADDDKLSDRYEILDKLGEGSFGTVYRMRDKESQLFYAVKSIPKKVEFCLAFDCYGSLDGFP